MSEKFFENSFLKNGKLNFDLPHLSFLFYLTHQMTKIHQK